MPEQRPSSLQRTLVALWILIVAVCVALGFLSWQVFEQGVRAQVREREETLARSLGEIGRRFANYRRVAGGDVMALSEPAVAAELDLMLTAVLAGAPGLEGGIADPADKMVAYAFPTHEGASAKRDVPQVELAQILEVVRRAREQPGLPARMRSDGARSSLLLAAQRLDRGTPGAVGWVMTRVPLDVGQSYRRFGLSVGGLLLLALGSGLWILRALGRWLKRVQELEAGIRQGAGERLPALPRTGERELDRIADALNDLSARLAESRARTEQLGRQLAHSERLASLGRMSAALAHEIGNPLAAMRLRAENAVAGKPERAPAALSSILEEIGRLDELLQRLKALTRLGEVRPQPVAVTAWLTALRARFGDQASAAGVSLELQTPADDVSATFDPATLTRALENLVLNALQHAPRGTVVRLAAEFAADGALRLGVADQGPGIPAGLASQIFEPFVSGRAEGSGLGLSIVREIAESHRGRAWCEPKNADGGATFHLELPPWPAS